MRYLMKVMYLYDSRLSEYPDAIRDPTRVELT